MDRHERVVISSNKEAVQAYNDANINVRLCKFEVVFKGKGTVVLYLKSSIDSKWMELFINSKLSPFNFERIISKISHFDASIPVGFDVLTLFLRQQNVEENQRSFEERISHYATHTHKCLFKSKKIWRIVHITNKKWSRMLRCDYEYMSISLNDLVSNKSIDLPNDDLVTVVIVETSKLNIQSMELLISSLNFTNNDNERVLLAYHKISGFQDYDLDKMVKNHHKFRKVVNFGLVPCLNSKDLAYCFNAHRVNNGYGLIFIPITKENNVNNKIEKSWWFEYITQSFACARGRIIQFEGTCWFTSAINIVLLSNCFKHLLDKHTKGYIPSRDPYVRNGIFSFDHNENHVTFDYEIEANVCISQRDWGPFDSFISFKYVDKKGLYSEQTQLAMSKFFKYKSNVSFAGALQYEYIECLLFVLKHLGEKVSYTHVSSVREVEKSNIIIVDVMCMMPTHLDFSSLIDSSYELVAGQFGLHNHRHIISGLVCDGVFYVYDSNNILQACDWHKQDLSQYEKVYKDRGVYKTLQRINHVYILVFRKKKRISTLVV